MVKLDKNTRILLVLVLLAGTAPGNRAAIGEHAQKEAGAALEEESSEPPMPLLKDATGCTLVEDPWGSSPFKPSQGGCVRGSEGCYICEYSSGGLTWTCYETPDGGFVLCPDVQHWEDF